MQGAKNMQTKAPIMTTDSEGKAVQARDTKTNELQWKKGSFTTPVDSEGNKVQGFGNRLAHSNYFSTDPY